MSPGPLWPQCSYLSAPTRGSCNPACTLPSQGRSPVRRDGLPIFLPPGTGLQGGVLLTEELHQAPQGRLHQGRLQACQADPGKWG